MVKLYSTKDSRQKEQLQMLLSQNNIPYKLKTKNSSPSSFDGLGCSRQYETVL